MTKRESPEEPVVSKGEIIRSASSREDDNSGSVKTPAYDHDETVYGTLDNININNVDPEDDRSFEEGETLSTTAPTANIRKVASSAATSKINKKISKSPKQRLSDLIRESIDEIRARVRDSVDHHEIIEDTNAVSPRDDGEDSNNSANASSDLFAIFAYPAHIEYWNAITMFAMPCIPVLYLYSQNLLVRESPFVYQNTSPGFSSDTPSPFDDDSNFFLYIYRLCVGVTATTVDYTRSTSMVREQRQLTRLPDPKPEEIIVHMGQNLVELEGGAGGGLSLYSPPGAQLQKINDVLTIRSHPSPLVQFFLLTRRLSLISIKILNYFMIIPASIGSHIFGATHGKGSYWWTRADNFMIGIAAMLASYLLLESVFWTLFLYLVITIPFLVLVDAKSIEGNTAEDEATGRNKFDLPPLKKKDVRLWTVFYRLITKKRLRATTNLEHTLLTIVLPGPPFLVLFAAGVLARFLIVWDAAEGIAGEVGMLSGDKVQKPKVDYLEAFACLILETFFLLGGAVFFIVLHWGYPWNGIYWHLCVFLAMTFEMKIFTDVTWMRLWRVTGAYGGSYLNRQIANEHHGDGGVNSHLFVSQVPALTYYLQWTLVGLAIAVLPTWKLASTCS